MEKEALQSASFKTKTKVKIPEGAEVTKKDIRMSVEEIENGFIVEKNYDINYTLNGDSKYEYFTKRWFSKKNPLKIENEKAFADNF